MQAGLLQHLGLTPVLAVVGPSRGPALGSDIDSSATTAAAKQSSLLGIPSVAVNIVTSSLKVGAETVHRVFQILSFDGTASATTKQCRFMQDVSGKVWLGSFLALR